MDKGRVKAAVTRWGLEACRKAFELNEKQGEGPSTIAAMLGLPTVNAANSAINAGRAIAKAEKLMSDFCKAGEASKSDVEFRNCVREATRIDRDLRSVGVFRTVSVAV